MSGIIFTLLALIGIAAVVYIWFIEPHNRRNNTPKPGPKPDPIPDPTDDVPEITSITRRRKGRNGE